MELLRSYIFGMKSLSNSCSDAEDSALNCPISGLYATILGLSHSIGPFDGLDICFVSRRSGVEGLDFLNSLE
jgi:hypothetical protein